MYSTNLITTHFWLATTGTVLYIVALWVSGITQGLMWFGTNPDGTLSATFIQSVVASHVPYIVRAVGGALYVGGMLVMAYNCYKTIKMPSVPEAIAEPDEVNTGDENAVKA